MKRRLDILQGKPVEPVRTPGNLERLIEHYDALPREDLYELLNNLIESGPEHDLQVVCELLSGREKKAAEEIKKVLDTMEGRQRLGRAMGEAVQQRREENRIRHQLSPVERLGRQSEG